MGIRVWIGEALEPSALKSIRGALRNYSDLEKHIPSLAANIATAYVTITLLAVGYLVPIIMRL